MLLHCFFFFFSHSCYWKNYQYYQYIYIHFPVNQINLLKFILFNFFSSFTHCKTLEKNASHHFFFSLNSGLFAQNFSNTCSHTNPSVQHFIFFLCAIHQAHKSHNYIKHSACSVLILSRDCLANHIPNPTPSHTKLWRSYNLRPWPKPKSPNP